jgi:hypothetical protein
VIEGKPLAVAIAGCEVVGKVVVEEEEGRRTNPDSTLLVVHTDMGGDLAELGRVGVRVLVVDLAEDNDGFLGSRR